LEHLFSKLSINRLLWFILILVAGSNVFLLSPFKIGETSIPITLCISILGIFFYFGILAKKKTIRFKLMGVDYLLLVYFIINTISTMINSFRYNYIYIIHNINGLLLILAGIIYYFFIRVCVKSYEKTILLFKIYFFSALIPSIYSILHFITWETGNPFLFKINYDLYFRFYRSGIFRTSGFTPEPSHFALYLSGVIFIGFFFLFIKKEENKKSLVISIIIISTALLLTFSQIIIFDLLFLFWYFLLVKRNGHRKYLYIILFILIFFILYGLDVLYDLGVKKLFIQRETMLFNTFLEGSRSNLSRVQSIKTGWKIFLKNPIVGIGINNLDLRMLERFSFLDYIEGHAGLHSKFIAILVESGILGFLAYFIFAIKVILKRINVKNFIKLPNNISYCFFVIFILTGISGKFETFFFFWFLAALSVNYNVFYSKYAGM